MICRSSSPYQTSSQRSTHEDPRDWILETYPWMRKADSPSPLLCLHGDDDDVCAGVETSGKRPATSSNPNGSDPLVSFFFLDLILISDLVSFNHANVKIRLPRLHAFLPRCSSTCCSVSKACPVTVTLPLTTEMWTLLVSVTTVTVATPR